MGKPQKILYQAFLGVSLLVTSAGCPDRSMLRPYPDLSKQSDTDSEDSEGIEPEQAELSEQAVPPAADSSNPRKAN